MCAIINYIFKSEISSASEDCYRKGEPVSWLFGGFTSYKLSQSYYCSTHHKVTKNKCEC